MSAGGATLSLLAPLHFDYKLSLFNGPDLMALPGVKQAVNWALGVSRCTSILVSTLQHGKE
jgi:hypothetical protein